MCAQYHTISNHKIVTIFHCHTSPLMFDLGRDTGPQKTTLWWISYLSNLKKCSVYHKMFAFMLLECLFYDSWNICWHWCMDNTFILKVSENICKMATDSVFFCICILNVSAKCSLSVFWTQLKLCFLGFKKKIFHVWLNRVWNIGLYKHPCMHCLSQLQSGQTIFATRLCHW